MYGLTATSKAVDWALLNWVSAKIPQPTSLMFCSGDIFTHSYSPALTLRARRMVPKRRKFEQAMACPLSSAVEKATRSVANRARGTPASVGVK
jgi:hypothetical protein